MSQDPSSYVMKKKKKDTKPTQQVSRRVETLSVSTSATLPHPQARGLRPKGWHTAIPNKRRLKGRFAPRRPTGRRRHLGDEIQGGRG